MKKETRDAQLQNRHLAYPNSIRIILSDLQKGGHIKALKAATKLIRLDYSTLQKAIHGDRSLPNVIARLQDNFPLSMGTIERLQGEYESHRSFWQLSDRRRSSVLITKKTASLDKELFLFGFKRIDLLDEERRSFIADTIIENYRISGKSDQALGFGQALLEWIDETYTDLDDRNVQLSIGSIARLMSYTAFMAGDIPRFTRAMNQLERAAESTNDNWLRGGHLHNLRRYQSVYAADDASPLIEYATKATNAAKLGMHTEETHPAARYWEPSHYLAHEAEVITKSLLGVAHPEEVERLISARDKLLVRHTQLDFLLVSEVGIAEAYLYCRCFAKAFARVGNVITILDRHLGQYSGIRAYARRVQGDMRFIEGATSDPTAREKVMQDARSLYIDAAHYFSIYGNRKAIKQIDGRLELTQVIELAHTRFSLDQLLAFPKFRTRIN